MGKKKQYYGVCTVCDDGKVQKIAAKGMCWKHYQRDRRRDGDLSDPEWAHYTEDCIVEGCDRKADTRNMCHMHYARVQAHGDPNIVLPKGSKPGEDRMKDYDKDTCVICGDELWARELCNKHYYNFKYHESLGRVSDVFDYLRLRRANDEQG